MRLNNTLYVHWLPGVRLSQYSVPVYGVRLDFSISTNYFANDQNRTSFIFIATP